MIEKTDTARIVMRQTCYDFDWMIIFSVWNEIIICLYHKFGYKKIIIMNVTFGVHAGCGLLRP